MKTTLMTALFTTFANGAIAEGSWIFGAFVDGETGIYVGEEDSFELLPYLAYETERLHIGLDGISYEVIDLDGLSVDITLDPRFAPDVPDSALFEGLDRDDALELGFAATYAFGPAYATLSLEGDVTDAHGGFAGEAALGYQLALGGIGIDASAGVKLRDAALNNYLFGVSEAEATATRAAFAMDDTANAFASISAVYEITDGVYVIGEVSYEDLGEAANSPLVEATERNSIVIGIGYEF